MGHGLPISGLVSKLGNHFLRPWIMVAHTPLAYHMSLCSPHASHLLFPPPPAACSLFAQPIPLYSCPFLTWIALPETCLRIEIIPLKILPDATSSVKPYRVAEGQSYTLSLLGLSFGPPLRPGSYLPLYANCVHASTGGGRGGRDCEPAGSGDFTPL